MKSKWKVTRGEGRGDTGGKEGGVFTMKDTGTKPKGGRITGGTWGRLGSGGVLGRKWRQVYLNNNKINVKKIK